MFMFTSESISNGQKQPVKLKSPLPKLSRRQHEVMKLLAGGAVVKNIATELGISVSAVQSHVSAVRMKLNCDTRGEAIACVIRHGLLD